MASAASSSEPQKPIKSAMRRTSSISQDASSMDDNNGKRYLPKGLGGGHSGLVMPTKPGQASGAYHSPEWGWYINTTPPTPEMYHSQYSSTKNKLPSSKDLPVSGRPAFATASNAPSTKTAAMGWPSVPL